MNARAALQAFLVERFPPDQLEQFATIHFGDYRRYVNWRSSGDDQVHAFIGVLRAHGLEGKLWPALREVRPSFVDAIDALAALWSAEQREIGDDGAPPPGDSYVLAPEA
jgi:hypothetical protein